MYTDKQVSHKGEKKEVLVKRDELSRKEDKGPLNSS